MLSGQSPFLESVERYNVSKIDFSNSKASYDVHVSLHGLTNCSNTGYFLQLPLITGLLSFDILVVNITE